MSVLAGLRPERVFYYFEELCRIPHGSGNTKEVSDYLVQFARDHELSWYQDASNNVIIRRPASKGCELAPTVILQGHCDMVCEKKPGSSHDFTKDGLELHIDGDEIYARDTTLGGDDGIAVAYMLAVLESDDLQLPAIEALITTDEEIGLLGAAALNGNELKGRTLLNMDSEEEGILTVSCAGGMTAMMDLPVRRSEVMGEQMEVTNRNAVDSVIGQRALREIYLEPYKIAIQESQPLSIMSSYNLINGVPTADSYDLCTDLARGEWGFEGLIMTDWNGGSSTPWKSMHAGNDLIMPGGKGRAMNILQTVRTVMPEFDERGQVIMVQEVPFAPVFAASWNSFTVDPEGPDTVMAPLGEGHTAEMKDGEILVDGEKVYMQANDMKTFFNDPASFVPKICPANEEVAFILDDGRAIGYKGHLDKKPRLCLGDVQRCAVHNLRIILKCMGL